MANLRYDLWRAVEKAAEVFPLPIVMAAFGKITVGEAALATQRRAKNVCREIADARLLIQELLMDYRPN